MLDSHAQTVVAHERLGVPVGVLGFSQARDGDISGA
jgi:hypothetical protein